MAHDAAEHAGDIAEVLGRIGYVAKGIVYGVIGLLAVQLAFTKGGKTTGTHGAVRTIGAQQGGIMLLWLVGLGLLAYAGWRAYRVVRPEGLKQAGSDACWGERFGSFTSALTNGSLGLYAIDLARRTPDNGGDWTAKIMAHPWGPWLIGAIGAGVFAFGLAQVWRGYKAKFTKEWRTHQMSAREQAWVTGLSRLGVTARGVALAMAGWIVVDAATGRDHDQAKRSLETALDKLANLPQGPWLLGAMAFGLICYGIYCFVTARYRRFAT